MKARRAPPRALVDVYRHQDYRAFLREYYERRKTGPSGFSLRAFSRKAGLRSPNYLKLVMDGARNLTPEMSLVFAEACGLEGEPAEYFCELVAFNQARSAKERELHYGRLKRFSRYRKTHRLDAAQDAYHSEWYIPAIRELVTRPDFDEDPRWIARTLLPPISSANARKALDVLSSLGLLSRNDAGRLVQVEPLIETADGPLGHHVASYHRTMMAHAAGSIDRVPREDREIASLTMCVSQPQLRELKGELERFRSELLQRFEAGPDAERVVQINFQLFPLSEKKKGDA